MIKVSISKNISKFPDIYFEIKDWLNENTNDDWFISSPIVSDVDKGIILVDLKFYDMADAMAFKLTWDF